jgi:hypothetical protein
MMQLVMLLGLLLVPASADDKTISNVVSMLQEMLDKSKEDGENDRKVYGDFKCFCDTKLEEKDESITVTQADVDSAEAQLADLRAENTKLSQEAAGLEKDIAANEQMREEASALRTQEKEAFEKTEVDLETGIGQLERAIEILSAVGADQTVSGDTSSVLSGAGADGSFLSRERAVSERSRKTTFAEVRHDIEEALRAASFFANSQHGLATDEKPLQKVKAFLQAPFTGNYNAQSGEIVGIIKNMNDTFTMNLANARRDEEKAQTAYDEMVEVKEKEHEEMTAAFDSKKQLIGDNAENIGTTTTEVQSMKEQLEVDTTFRDSLLERCPKKAEEYKIRTTLRANEEAAIAQAIAVLDRVAKNIDKTSSAEKLSLLQLTLRDDPGVPTEVIRSLMRAAGKTHSFRIAHVAAALEVKNPFSKVLEMIEKTLKLIDVEEADDEKYHAWCETEQEENEASKSEKETNLQTLETTISELEIALQSSKDSIETGRDDLKTTRETKTQAVADRKEENKQFSMELRNFEEALSGLAEAKTILSEFYAKVAKKNEELEEKAALLRLKTTETAYQVHVLKDSPGGKLMQVKGMVSIAKLKVICSAKPDCVAFNSKGWLLSSLAPEGEWYHWSGGNLYVKKAAAPAPAAPLEIALLQRAEPLEGEPDATLSRAGEGSDKVLEMLDFVAEEVSKEKDVLIGNEQSAQSSFEEEMQGLEAEEATLDMNLNQYALNKANQEKAIEEAHDDITATTKEKMAIEFYLEKIEPGCTFIQTNFETRKTNRAAEKEALESAIEMLKGTPAFLKAEAAAEKAAMGKCAGICEEKGKEHAECGACLNGVSVFGYCSSPKNADAPGCVDATATSSADALK